MQSQKIKQIIYWLVRYLLEYSSQYHALKWPNVNAKAKKKNQHECHTRISQSKLSSMRRRYTPNEMHNAVHLHAVRGKHANDAKASAKTHTNSVCVEVKATVFLYW